MARGVGIKRKTVKLAKIITGKVNLQLSEKAPNDIKNNEVSKNSPDKMISWIKVSVPKAKIKSVEASKEGNK